MEAPHKFELAKTGRGACNNTGKKILQGEVRFGSFNAEVGNYGRWVSIPSMKVPFKLWSRLNSNDLTIDSVVQGLLDASDVVAGFEELDVDQRREIAGVVADKQRWASGLELATASTSKAVAETMPIEELVELPTPKPNAFENMTFVLTGTFEKHFGGGSGLKTGKNGMKEYIESANGRVATSISGKTSCLIVGNTPGVSKFNAAKQKGLPTLDPVSGLAFVANGGNLENAPVVSLDDVTSFSVGFVTPPRTKRVLDLEDDGFGLEGPDGLDDNVKTVDGPDVNTDKRARA